MVSIGQIVEVIEETSKDAERERRELSASNQFSVDTKNQRNTQTSTQSSSTISKFKIRVPLLHGISGEASAVPDSQLPDATFCALPGSEQTKLNNGDLVYVAIVDFDYSKIVIIGFVSQDQATTSRSGAALTRIQKLEMDKNGEASFSQNISITDGKDTIDWTNLKSLSGFTNRLQDYVWPIENGGTGVSINKSLSESQIQSAQKQMRDNFGIFSTKIVSSSEFEKIQSGNKYEKNTIYYIWDDDEGSPTRQTTSFSSNSGIDSNDYGLYALDFLWNTVRNYEKRINNPTYTGHDGYGPANSSTLWQQKVIFGNRIKQTLQNFGYSVREILGNRHNESQEIINNNIKSYVCSITGKNSSKKIVIGAHYDSVYTGGLEDNGTGVAVLLELAQRFKRIKPNFDVDFCFWDGEEFLTYAGSYSYVSTLSAAEKQKILLYINLDSIGAGDTLYAYGGKYVNGQLQQAWGYNFAKKIANDFSIPLKAIPNGIHTTNPSYTDNDFKSPTRLVASDQYFFQSENIPYVYFEANAWVNKDGVTCNPFRPYMYNTTNSIIEATSYEVPDKNGQMTGSKYNTDKGQLIHAEIYDDYDFLRNNSTFYNKIQTHLPQVSKIVSYMVTTITTNTPNEYKKEQI